MKALLTLLAACSVTLSIAQELLWIKQSRVSEAIEFEKRINPTAAFISMNVSLSKDYYPLADKYRVTNPLIVERKQSGLLPLAAEYFYTPQDSILRLVSYDWERGKYVNFFQRPAIWKEESAKLDLYQFQCRLCLYHHYSSAKVKRA
jgi:hypothetical protein